MTTNTPAPLPPVRQDPRQVANTLKKTVNWNDPGLANGVALANGLPQGAFILDVLVEVVTPFNGTTPSITVGTNAANYNNIVNAGDVDETAAAVTRVTRGLGRSLAAAGDVIPFVKGTLAGDTTQGQLVIAILYDGGWDT